MRGQNEALPGLWLKVKGVGLVHGRADLATQDARALAGQAVLTQAMLAEPELTDLPPLLAQYYGDAPAPALRRVPRYARLGLLAALRALHSAGWDKETLGAETAETAEGTQGTIQHEHGAALPGAQTMLTLGTAHSGVSMSMDFMDSLLDQGPRLSSPTAFSHAVNNMGAGLLSLLLGVRGSCQTLSQFSLSFAAALHAAALALHGGRAARALVGAVDETDPRFDLHTPAHAAGPHAVNATGESAWPPAAQGAVFLCVEAARQDESGLCVHWGEAAHEKSPGGTPAPSPTLTLLSGDARPADMTDTAQDLLCLAPHYGITPLAQALDVVLALRQDIPTVRCVCAHAPSGCTATVEVRRFA